MEKRKQELVGKVVSDKNDKTITVLVETYKKDPLYGNVLNILKNILPMMKRTKRKWETLLESLKLDHYQSLNIFV